MKKSLFVLMCMLGLGVASLASAQSNDFSVIQRLLNTLEGQMAALKATQPAQVSGVATKAVTTKSNSSVSITSGDDPITGNPNPVPGGVLSCAGGATMPAGSIGQMIYCDGIRWKNTSSVNTDGNHVGIGVASEVSKKLKVYTSNINGVGVDSFGPKTGVIGQSSSGVGVLGTSRNIAVKAVPFTADAFGFYQEGPGKNYFQSKVGIGTQNPAESLDLGGGNIKMGYEIVTNNQDSASNVYAVCPVGKKVISGGCSVSGHADDGTIPLLRTSKPTPDGSRWSCEYGAEGGFLAGYVTATAICANIR